MTSLIENEADQSDHKIDTRNILTTPELEKNRNLVWRGEINFGRNATATTVKILGLAGIVADCS